MSCCTARRHTGLRSHARHLARFAPRIGPPRSSPPEWNGARLSAATTASLNAPVLNVKELRILTPWAEALAEVVFAGSERLDTSLAAAWAAAPWRVGLGVRGPSPRVRSGIAEIGSGARRATAGDALATVSALVAEVEQGGDGVAALSARGLQSRIAARGAGTVGR